MGAIPEELRVSQIWNETSKEMEQERFVQVATSKRVICFVPQMIRTAKERGELIHTAYAHSQKSLGITTFASDGVFSVAPRELGDRGQLYTVHGISPTGICVPIINYIIASSSTESYLPMYRTPRNQLEAVDFNISSLCF